MAGLATGSPFGRSRNMSMAGIMGIGGTVILSVAALFLFCGLLCIVDAMLKDRSRVAFLLIGLLLGPIGLIVTGMIPSVSLDEGRTEAGALRKSIPDAEV